MKKKEIVNVQVNYLATEFSDRFNMRILRLNFF